MAKPSEGQSAGSFSPANVIISTCAVLILALSAIVWNNLSGDISDLKKDQKETTKIISDIKLEIVKGFGNIEKQGAQTNQKLEDFIIEMRKRR